MTAPQKKVKDVIEILRLLGLPPAQQNERSALCLLALLDISPTERWSQATSRRIGIAPIIQWCDARYGVKYASGTRETFRRFTMHQFVAAGIAICNPDDPSRPTNSPKTVYEIDPNTLNLLQTYKSRDWKTNLAVYLSKREQLTAKYAKVRDLERVALQINSGNNITFSPGRHSDLIKAIIENFGPIFVPGGIVIYAGDTGSNRYFDQSALAALGVKIDEHGKMPDAVIYYPDRNWLVLAEAMTSHGPVDGKRYEELKTLFSTSTAGLVYVTAFPDRTTMAKYLSQIAWETEVWCADSPTHLIHFNGIRFLGPYSDR